MGKRFVKKKSSQVVDEYNQPTEPLVVVLPPQMDTVPVTLPTPVAPVPSRQNVPFPPAAPNAPKFDPYPYDQPASGPGMSSPHPIKGSTQAQKPAQHSIARPFFLRLLPLGVGLFFVCIQLLLLARFVVRLFEIPIGTAWVSVVYALSNLCLLPFQALLPPVSIPWLANVEIYTLLAVLVYGLFSRLLVRLLKILLNGIYQIK